MSGFAVVLPTQVASRKTCIIKGQFVDPNTGLPVVPTAVTLTLCDTKSRALVNGVSQVNILNTGRGVVDVQGNLTLTLGAGSNQGDTQKLTPYENELRSAIIEWTFGSGPSYGAQEVQFPIVSILPG